MKRRSLARALGVALAATATLIPPVGAAQSYEAKVTRPTN